MPIPANKASQLLSLMGIQTWVRRKDIHRQKQLLQLDLSIKQCGHCALHTLKSSNCMGLGEQDAPILLIRDQLESEMDATGNKTQQLFKNLLASVDLTPEMIYTTGIVKCTVSSAQTSLQPEHINACAQHLFRLVQLIKPVVVVTMGEKAAQYFQQGGSDDQGFMDYHGIPMLIMHSLEHLLHSPRDKKQVYKQFQQVKAWLN